MTSVTELVYNTLAADATLMALLTGGIYNGETVITIDRQKTPAAFDAYSELKPCALVKPESTTPWGPHEDSGRLYLTIWIYAQTALANLEAARTRIYSLLHRKQISGATKLYDIRSSNDLMGSEIAVLKIPTIISRYVITLQRD